MRRGDVLIELDDQDERAALAQAQAAVAQAEAKMRQLREVALPAAEQALSRRRPTSPQRASNTSAARTWRRRVSSPSRRSTTRSATSTSPRASCAPPGCRSKRTARPAATTRSRRPRSQQAQASLAVAQARLEQTVIRAPVDGILIGRSVEPGNVAQPGKELMALAPAGETQVVVADRREEPGAAHARPEGAGLRRCVSARALRRRARLHQPRHRPAARLRRSQAARRRTRPTICART